MHSYDAVFLPQTQTRLVRTLRTLSNNPLLYPTRVITRTIAKYQTSVMTTFVCRLSVLVIQI
jgi:hypothetical protein